MQVNLPADAWGLTLNKDEPNRYHIAQFHFHWPSEHVVSGQHFDMEVGIQKPKLVNIYK